MSNGTQENSSITDQITTQVEKMSIEQNGVPAGDTGMVTAPVTPAPAQPESPHVAQPAQSQPEPAQNATAHESNKEHTPEAKEEDSKEQAAQKDAQNNFKQMFRAFAKFGDTKSDGKLITLSQSDKWMKQAKVIDGKKITTTDTGIYFKKLKSLKVNYDDYQKFLEDLAKNKKIEVEEIKKKMMNCGTPGLHAAGSGGKPAATVERLTDPKKYTGSHRQRFDETGKGRGIAGRKDLPDNSGYVSGYINKNTYDKTH